MADLIVSERRFAVLIASSRFPVEPKLQPLRCPENDVDRLQEVLASPVFGGFDDVAVLKNVAHHESLLKINQTLKAAARDDLVFLYYSGHGKLDAAGRLHLATVNTTVEHLEATSIPVDQIRNFIDVGSTSKIALVLDCCFSGAVGAAFARGGVDDQLQRFSGGRGTYLLTASTAVQVALEKEADENGVFTKHLLDGIRSGGADVDGDGHVTMDELYRYVHRHMLDEGFQEPMKWDLNVRGQLVIAGTGKAPREQRRRELRSLLLDLAGQGVLPDRVLARAMEILAAAPSELDEAARRLDRLLDDLRARPQAIGEFLDRWYDARAAAPVASNGVAATDAPVSEPATAPATASTLAPTSAPLTIPPASPAGSSPSPASTRAGVAAASPTISVRGPFKRLLLAYVGITVAIPATFFVFTATGARESTLSLFLSAVVMAAGFGIAVAINAARDGNRAGLFAGSVANPIALVGTMVALEASRVTRLRTETVTAILLAWIGAFAAAAWRAYAAAHRVSAIASPSAPPVPWRLAVGAAAVAWLVFVHVAILGRGGLEGLGREIVAGDFGAAVPAAITAFILSAMVGRHGVRASSLPAIVAGWAANPGIYFGMLWALAAARAEYSRGMAAWLLAAAAIAQTIVAATTRRLPAHGEAGGSDRR